MEAEVRVALEQRYGFQAGRKHAVTRRSIVDFARIAHAKIQ